MPVKNLSFPKTRRLTASSQFELVRKDGRTQRGKLLMLGVLAEARVDGLRAGFVTSGRIGGAALRNRVRRRLRTDRARPESAQRACSVTVGSPPATTD